MAARDARVHGVDLAARHELGLLHRALNGLHRGFDVHHHALLQSARRVAADADDLELAVGFHLADDGDDLARADVEPYGQIAVGTFGHVESVFLQASESSGCLDEAAGVCALRQPMAKPFE